MNPVLLASVSPYVVGSFVGYLVLMLAIGALNLFPTFNVTVYDEVFGTGFGTFTRRIYETYNPAVEHVYSTREVAFVKQALDRMPEDALVTQFRFNDGNCDLNIQTQNRNDISQRLHFPYWKVNRINQRIVSDTVVTYTISLLKQDQSEVQK